MSKYPKFNPEKLTKRELIQLLALADELQERANIACNEPGILFSEALYREWIDREIEVL